jgi:acyl carrier protein
MLDRRLVEAMNRALKLNPGSITPETSQENTEAWDSLAHLNLILEIEAAFGVRFSSEEIPLLTSVARLQEALERHGAL